MKKQKLVLRSETIRLLSEEVLDKVVGGYTTPEEPTCGGATTGYTSQCGTSHPCRYPA